MLRTGWPDFLCSRDGEVRGVEVKGPTDTLRPEQVAMQRMLHDSGLVTYTYRFRTSEFEPQETFDGILGVEPAALSRKQLLDIWSKVQTRTSKCSRSVTA